MDKPQPSPVAELERLQEWARIGLALHVAANAVIAMRYPHAALASTPPQGEAGHG